VLALDSDLRGEGGPRRLTHLNTTILSTAWSADGRWILFEAMPYVFAFYLWRVPADGRPSPQRVEAAGLWARAPATARATDLVVFTRSVRRIELRRFQRGGTTQALSLSSFSDLDGSYSPDGTRIALASGRSGQSLDIWVSALDGSGAVQLTQGLGRHTGGPKWSPDGRRLAFDVLAADGQWDVWLVDVDGGSPVRLTSDPSDENISGWSRDGKWVYFWTGRNGQSNIWRMPALGGPQEQVTTGGAGINSCESVDGRILFYSAAVTDAPLLALPLMGGPPRRVLECVREGGFRVTRQGLYYVGCGPTASPPLHFVDGGTGRDTILGVLERAGGGPLWHLSVSPDDREVLYSGIVDPGADLMLIRNLR
jgi:Tol biopolymer transport system component